MIIRQAEEARKRAQRRRRRNAAVATLVALVGAAFFAVLGTAQSQTASPALSARLNSAAQAGTSRIAFTSYPVPPPHRRITELYVVNADGSEKRVLARSRTQLSGGAAWSPDGQTIAFHGLFLNADGSGRRNVAREWGLDPTSRLPSPDHPDNERSL